jgi:hypothetical protein
MVILCGTFPVDLGQLDSFERRSSPRFRVRCRTWRPALGIISLAYIRGRTGEPTPSFRQNLHLLAYWFIRFLCLFFSCFFSLASERCKLYQHQLFLFYAWHMVTTYNTIPP